MSRWKLGQMLAVIERIAAGPGHGKKDAADRQPFKVFLERLGLDHRRAVEIQRIGALPASSPIRSS
jgi:hypothetical protein